MGRSVFQRKLIEVNLGMSVRFFFLIFSRRIPNYQLTRATPPRHLSSNILLSKSSFMFLSSNCLKYVYSTPPPHPLKGFKNALSRTDRPWNFEFTCLIFVRNAPVWVLLLPLTEPYEFNVLNREDTNLWPVCRDKTFPSAICIRSVGHQSINHQLASHTVAWDLA